MKFIISIFLFFSFLWIDGQVKRFIYEYEFISDSTKSHTISKEIMFLDILDNKSEFYGYQKFQIDSAIVADAQKGLFSMPPNKDFLDYRVKKNIETNYDTDLIIKVGAHTYDVVDKRRQNWKISNEVDQILGYSVQKAILDFGGRKWTAWFTKDIPLQDGPYKFCGLPGLILKIEDKTNSHKFIIKGINLLHDDKLSYPQREDKIIKISESEYKKLFTEYRIDPVKNLRGRMPDQTDGNGNFISGEEALRRSEQAFRKRIDADNNIIEIDLIKG